MVKKKGRVNARLPKIRKALESRDTFEAITGVREAIAEKNSHQMNVVWVYACILETNSACLTILLDRFEPSELAEIERALGEIGATRTASDLGTLRQEFDKAVAGGLDALDASEKVTESAVGQRIETAYQAHVAEMEAKLLAYCAANVEDLAAG